MRIFIMRLWLAGMSLGLLTCFSAAQAADKIIVSGASGQLGGLAVQELLARGVKPADLILVSRTPDKLGQYAKLGAAVRFGDPTQPESLPAAYAGGTKMLLISLGRASQPPPVAHKAAFDAAVKAGVQHIVYTSTLGADKGDTFIAADHKKSEEHLRASGAKWTILRNGPYMEAAIERAQKMITNGRGVVPANESKGAPVARADCAAAAAGALTRTDTQNKVYDITGSELVGVREMAAAASQITGRPITVVEGPAVPAAPAPASGPAPGAGPGTSPPAGGATQSDALMAMAPLLITNAVAELSGRPATTLRALFRPTKTSC